MGAASIAPLGLGNFFALESWGYGRPKAVRNPRYEETNQRLSPRRGRQMNGG